MCDLLRSVQWHHPAATSAPLWSYYLPRMFEAASSVATGICSVSSVSGSGPCSTSHFFQGEFPCAECSNFSSLHCWYPTLIAREFGDLFPSSSLVTTGTTCKLDKWKSANDPWFGCRAWVRFNRTMSHCRTPTATSTSVLHPLWFSTVCPVCAVATTSTSRKFHCFPPTACSRSSSSIRPVTTRYTP